MDDDGVCALGGFQSVLDGGSDVEADVYGRGQRIGQWRRGGHCRFAPSVDSQDLDSAVGLGASDDDDENVARI